MTPALKEPNYHANVVKYHKKAKIFHLSGAFPKKNKNISKHLKLSDSIWKLGFWSSFRLGRPQNKINLFDFLH